MIRSLLEALGAVLVTPVFVAATILILSLLRMCL